jgi:hypothetical protein
MSTNVGVTIGDPLVGCVTLGVAVAAAGVTLGEAVSAELAGGGAGAVHPPINKITRKNERTRSVFAEIGAAEPALRSGTRTVDV